MNFLTTVLNMCIIFLSFVLTIRRCFGNSHDNKNYSFGYSVEAAEFGVVSQHWEERKGDFVIGQYSFLDSDGKVRVVGYQVEGDKGFRAVVTYRQPGGQQVLGHLTYPKEYQSPLRHQRPVSLITPDILYGTNKYPHMSIY